MGVRRIFVVLLAAVTISALLPIGPAAAGYRGALDITFPTTGSARYGNDYANWRSGGRRHMATDVFAPAGSRVVAAHAGRVIWVPPYEYPSAGYAVWIRDGRGRVFAYYHMGPAGGRRRQAIARGLSVGDRVRRGQLIGWVGDSGNAAGGSSHLHFEIHDTTVRDPYGVARRNPYYSLRRAEGRGVPRASRSGQRSTALRIGSRGPAVERWQQRLNRVIRAGLVTDGVFGPATRAATVRFQRSAGLTGGGLGVVGPRTRAAMQRRTDRATSARSGRTLRVGSRGPAVQRWQRKLNRATAAGLAVDGAFGPATRAATIRFQRRAGLSGRGLGIVGPRTRAAMARNLRGGAAPVVRPAAAPSLQFGSRGAAVVRWQRRLNRAAAAGLAADGVFGPATRAATVRFQRSAGLGPRGLGIVGPRTRAAMAKRLRNR